MFGVGFVDLLAQLGDFRVMFAGQLKLIVYEYGMVKKMNLSTFAASPLFPAGRTNGLQVG